MNDMEIISIYGPNRKKCWDNYKTYMGEIVFDGKSVVYKIHECGVCLVLSSENHIEDSVCSNRLFEGLAAGVPIISDRNPFIQKWFGDNIFYIDNDDIDKASGKICEYIKFFKENPEETLEKMKNCREIFLTHFLLDTQIQNLVENVLLLRK
jgi:glycosyltransferase involved in cell wall biosynthesis